jgi:hypothetical protein
LASIRVLHCLTVTVLRSKASFTRRSVSSRISCFDMSRFLCISFLRNRLHFLPTILLRGTALRITARPLHVNRASHQCASASCPLL